MATVHDIAPHVGGTLKIEGPHGHGPSGSSTAMFWQFFEGCQFIFV
jgi:hypothetical protein